MSVMTSPTARIALAVFFPKRRFSLDVELTIVYATAPALMPIAALLTIEEIFIGSSPFFRYVISMLKAVVFI